jgi:hypothetical protein
LVADIERRVDEAKTGLTQFIAELTYKRNPDVDLYLAQVGQLAKIEFCATGLYLEKVGSFTFCCLI